MSAIDPKSLRNIEIVSLFNQSGKSSKELRESTTTASQIVLICRIIYSANPLDLGRYALVGELMSILLPVSTIEFNHFIFVRKTIEAIKIYIDTVRV